MLISDWSADLCSSDLDPGAPHAGKRTRTEDSADSASAASAPIQFSAGGLSSTLSHDRKGFDPTRIPANYQSLYTTDIMINGLRLLRKMCELNPMLLASKPQQIGRAHV